MSIEISIQRSRSSSNAVKTDCNDDNVEGKLKKEKNKPINIECAHCWVHFESIECTECSSQRKQKPTPYHLKWTKKKLTTAIKDTTKAVMPQNIKIKFFNSHNLTNEIKLAIFTMSIWTLTNNAIAMTMKWFLSLVTWVVFSVVAVAISPKTTLNHNKWNPYTNLCCYWNFISAILSV